MLDGNFVLLGEVVVEGKIVAADDGCGAEECEAGVWEGRKGVSERETVQRQVDERGGEGMPTWSMTETVPKKKRSLREKRWESGLARRNFSALIRSERRMCSASRARPG